MKNLLDSLIADYTVLQAVPEPVVYLVFMVIFAFVVAGVPLSLYSGLLTYAERRVAGKMQSRVGPNRVGPQGLFQFLADGVKLIEKEDIIPAETDKLLFRLAPYLVFLGCILTYVVLPFGDGLIVSDLNIGIFYALAVSSIVVIGILMAGWASNNKWSLLGGMRSAAHIVSYEIPSGIALIAAILVAGSLSTQSIIGAQGWDFANWNIFHNPFTFIAFFIYFAAAMAEINRAPFDFPEAESELVSGYNTEYSGMRFAIFFLAEFANIYVISAIAVTVFLGGWHTPSFLTLNFYFFGLVSVPLNLFAVVSFFVKSAVLMFIILWLRWTLPRLRIDQLMDLCWKYLVPMAMFCLFGTALWMVLFDTRSLGDLLGRWFVNGVVVLAFFFLLFVCWYRSRWGTAPDSLADGAQLRRSSYWWAPRA